MTNWRVPHDIDLDETGQETARRRWVLLELVSVAILLSVALSAIGGLVGGFLYAQGPSGGGTSGYWLALEFGSRWVNPPVAGLLLAELAVCWLGYGQWAGSGQDATAGTIRVHVERLSRLVWWTQVVFTAVFVAAVASMVSLIVVDHQSISGVPSAQIWGTDLYGVFNALAVIAITSVGTYASARLLRATRRYLASPVATATTSERR